jgi:AmiR/NasT family two-component response regulator
MSEMSQKPFVSGGPVGFKSIVHELVDLSAVVVAPTDDQIDMLLRELQRFNMRARQIWPMPESIPMDGDVVFCEYVSDLARRLPWVPGDAKSALVVIVPAAEAIKAEALYHATPNGILARPFTTNAVLSSLVLARSQFGYERRLRSKIEKLDDNLRSIRTVERAKDILMEVRHMPEDEAYGFIRRQAMDRRVSVNVVAAAIVDSFELLGYDHENSTQ